MLKLGIEWGDSRVDFFFQRDERTRRVIIYKLLLHLKILKTLYIKNYIKNKNIYISIIFYILNKTKLLSLELSLNWHIFDETNLNNIQRQKSKLDSDTSCINR